MANRERLVLVDGSALIYRAFFAIPANFTTAAGLHTNASYGFATMFRKLFAGRKPDRGAVIFDAPGKTFRAEKYPEYKAQRPPMPSELRAQLPWIDRIVEAYRFPLLRVPGFEADDVIGTLTRLGVAAGMEVVIVSGDKDFAQLVGPDVKMMDTLRDVTYDAELVFKKWGVKPEHMVDLLALMGDSSDNIPGVAGIGQKGAATLIAAYGSLQSILDHTAELKGKQRTSLEENRAIALLSHELATIDCNVPLELGLDDLHLPSPDPAALNVLYKELEFYSLLAAEDRGPSDASAPAAQYTLLDTEDAARAAIASLDGKTFIVHPLFDLASPMTGDLGGLAFSSGAGHGFYLPFIAEGTGGVGLGLVKDLLEDAARPKVVYDAKALWILLRRQGIELAGVVFDVMLASFLIEPTKVIPHRLDQIAKEYLHRTLPALKELTGSGQKEKRLREIPASAACEHACAQAEAIAALHPLLKERLDALPGMSAHLAGHDLPLSFVLARMELDGIRVDPDDMKRMGVEFHGRLDEYEKTIYALAGQTFNIGSTKQLATVLFEDLKLPVIKRTKTGYSTDSDVLERLAPKHDIVRHLLEHRKLAKLINTYTDVLERAVNPATGRIHTTFEQTVGATGRLITTDPDLQRTPVRTPEGRRIRKAFIPAEGCVLISADWSQIELRLLAHFSADASLVEAFNTGLDVHRRTAARLFHVEVGDVTSAQRNVGKTVNFATIYGQGATALGQILDIPRKDAEAYIEGYFAAHPGVRAWLDGTIEAAHKTGYVTTLLGRRRYIPELSSHSVMDKQAGERIAANTPIQGSGADICKLAMLAIAATLTREKLATRMLLQIHDELVFETPHAEVDRVRALVKDAMENVYPLNVPLIADVGVGNSWAEAH